MSDQVPPSPVPPSQEQRARYQDALAELVEIGMEIAHQVNDRIKRHNAQDRPIARLVQAFNEVARAVRRTILLAEHLAKPPEPEPRRHREQSQAAHPKASTAQTATDQPKLDTLDAIDSHDRYELFVATGNEGHIDEIREALAHADNILNRRPKPGGPDLEEDNPEPPYDDETEVPPLTPEQTFKARTRRHKVNDVLQRRP